MISQRHERIIVGLILAMYVLLGLVFSSGPIFEGPDEIEHYRFIRTLLETRALPDPASQPRSQYHQAPLYYLIAAPLAALFHDNDFAQIDGRINPFYPYQMAVPGNDNKNLYLHTRAEAFPYSESGTAQAVHALRLLSIVLGAGTILTSYRVFSILWPHRPDRRLIAVASVAFLPQFVFMSSTINNDNLLYLCTSLFLWLILRQSQLGPSWQNAFGLGIVLGLTLLTKASAAFLILPIGVATVLDRRTWRFVPLILTITFTVAGWWYIRNWIIYGDPTLAWESLLVWKTEAIRNGSIALGIGLSRLSYSYATFWARFGQGAVAVGPPIYLFFNSLTLLTCVGMAGNLIRHLRTGVKLPAVRQFLIVTSFGATWIVMLIYFASTAWSGNQGRYLLPGIAVWGACIAFGLDVLTPYKLRLNVALLETATLAGVVALCVVGYFLPSYKVWPLPAAIAQPLSLRYGDVAELIGMSPNNPKGHPGDVIHIMLYWRALHTTPLELQTYLHTLDSDLVRRDSFPAMGHLLSTDWQPDETWTESYVVPIPDNAPIRTIYPLLAGLYDPVQHRPLAVTDGLGNTTTPIIGHIIISGIAEAHAPAAYHFGNSIDLSVPQITYNGNQLKVCLRWQSLHAMTTDYKVFVHVLTESDMLLTQADFQPRQGLYPTSDWEPGEIIPDCATLPNVPNLATGTRIAVGLYDVTTGQRLAVQDANGNTLPNSRVIVPLPETQPRSAVAKG
ncbi:MAG: glycosyltransferase family 39 protein [Chloroflexota bacterium]